jgi:glycosyltransferase involved in cell wall biosynthesis
MLMDNISVIIRNRNEERYIGYAIQSVLDTFKKPEIIVVDNNSTDNSMGIVNSFDFEDIKVHTMDSYYTPGRSLNYGVTKCSNDYILILSAHSQIMNCEFEKIQDLLENHCVVGGKQIPVWNGKKISRRYVWSNFIDKDGTNLFSNNENRYFLHNAFAFYKKETLIKYPFDESLSTKEDRYWVNALIESGMKSYYDSDTVCHHHYTDNGATWKGIG